MNNGIWLKIYSAIDNISVLLLIVAIAVMSSCSNLGHIRGELKLIRETIEAKE